MKNCIKCNTPLDDNAEFCTNCGERQSAPQGAAPGQQQQTYYMAPDPYDHTAEFTPKDISDNKVIAMLVYLMGAIGIIIALLVGNASPYAAFHVRQALKFAVVEALMAVVTLVLCWTFIVPIAAAILLVVLFVIKVICFFQICSGKAIEPYLIRSLKFMR